MWDKYILKLRLFLAIIFNFFYSFFFHFYLSNRGCCFFFFFYIFKIYIIFFFTYVLVPPMILGHHRMESLVHYTALFTIYFCLFCVHPCKFIYLFLLSQVVWNSGYGSAVCVNVSLLGSKRDWLRVRYAGPRKSLALPRDAHGDASVLI